MTKQEVFDMIEKDIEDAKPTEREANRNGLKKYLSKITEFEGTVEDYNAETKRTMLKCLTLVGKNKCLADHIWVNLTDNHPMGTKVRFRASVTNYRSKGERKYRLSKIHRVERVIG